MGQSGELDINTADEDALARALKGNREKARQIIQFRDGIEGFKSWDDVMKFPGINEDMIENLRSAGFTFGGKKAA